MNGVIPWNPVVIGVIVPIVSGAIVHHVYGVITTPVIRNNWQQKNNKNKLKSHLEVRYIFRYRWLILMILLMIPTVIILVKNYKFEITILIFMVFQCTYELIRKIFPHLIYNSIHEGNLYHGTTNI